jgi:hypothetical protein
MRNFGLRMAADSSGGLSIRVLQISRHQELLRLRGRNSLL